MPVIGVLPILPGDYTADALFLTGGNATLSAAMVAVAQDHFEARTVAIISSDNPGANASVAALTASLDLAGIAHTTVKGGDNETDAGFQGSIREAAADDPDLLISVYSGRREMSFARSWAMCSMSLRKTSTPRRSAWAGDRLRILPDLP